MVIAAYAGCGKTTFARNTWNSIDMVCVPYKYDVTDELEDHEAERKKADYGYAFNPDWPRNYISAVISAYHRYRYVIIPTVMSVLEELQRFRIPYILCYPEHSLKEEYRERYKNRGNSEIFETVFVGGWETFLSGIESDEYGKHIKLGPGEYLQDRQKEIERYTREKETVISIDIDASQEEKINQIFEKTGVCIEEQCRQLMYYIVENEEVIARWKENGEMQMPDGYQWMGV